LGENTQKEGSVRNRGGGRLCVHSLTDSAWIGMFRLQIYVDNYLSSKHKNFDINQIINNIKNITLVSAFSCYSDLGDCFRNLLIIIYVYKFLIKC
jgi:hypothetical protein